jgi:putative Mg2+ transporter-C (MgtC) family protein
VFEAVFTIREITLASITIRILASVLLGGIIGMERGMKNRPAGMRTYMLVSLGSCVVMLTNQYIYQVFNTGDPARMSAQVISGIGFLGAGTIIVTGRNQIKGLTTAAGLYEVAILSGVFVFLILTILHKFDDYVRRSSNVVELYVEMKANVPLGRFLRAVRAKSLDATNVQVQEHQSASDEFTSFVVSLKGQRHTHHDDIVRIVEKIDVVTYVEEL